MDLLETKNRVAEALVESIFRRARYGIVSARRDGGASLRVGREDFSPDFRVICPDDRPGKEFPVKVRYHPQIEQFLSVETQRGKRSVFSMARRQWPDMWFVLASDRPEAGRSCFQAIRLADADAGYRAEDLTSIAALGIFEHNVTDHEELLRRIFALLTGS
jgi:hypothetical protein